jgi:hypothetical protein
LAIGPRSISPRPEVSRRFVPGDFDSGLGKGRTCFMGWSAWRSPTPLMLRNW